MRRVQAAEANAQQPTYKFGDLTVDFAKHLVSLGSENVKLTATEYRIISYLARNAGRVLSPDQILTQVWGYSYCGENHILQVNMARLRRKLESGVKENGYILTRPSIGYMMQKD